MPLSIAMGVGVVTSLIGYLYSKCTKGGFDLLWKTIPSSLLGGSGGGLCELLRRFLAAEIVLTMTLGGFLVATLSTLYFLRLLFGPARAQVMAGGLVEASIAASGDADGSPASSSAEATLAYAGAAGTPTGCWIARRFGGIWVAGGEDMGGRSSSLAGAELVLVGGCCHNV